MASGRPADEPRSPHAATISAIVTAPKAVREDRIGVMAGLCCVGEDLILKDVTTVLLAISLSQYS